MSDDGIALRAATVAVANASGWTPEQLEAHSLKGSLCERQARAALEAGQAIAGRAGGGLRLSRPEAACMREGLMALQVAQRKHALELLAKQDRALADVLDDLLTCARDVEALLAKVDEYLRTSERVEAASEGSQHVLARG